MRANFIGFHNIRAIYLWLNYEWRTVVMGPREPEGNGLVATAPDPASKERYRPELDGIRAFCILFTILNHIPGHPVWINGSVGVDVFFALSGWLITALMLREYQNTGGISLASFYTRRVFRILPLYYGTVVLYVVLALAGAKAGGVSELQHSIAYMLTMCMEYRPSNVGNLFGHAWTLGIEEKFYGIWPLILAATIRKPWLAGLGGCVAFGVLVLTFGVTPLILRGYCGLGFGAGLAMLALMHEPVGRFLGQRVSPAPFLILMLAAYVASVFWPDNFGWNIMIALAAALTIGTLWFRRKVPTAAILSLKPLPWLGRLTYAIYLVQSICIRMAEAILHAVRLPQNTVTIFLVAYGLAIAVAAVAHVAIEKPLIRFGRGFAAKWRHQPVVAA